MSRHTDDQPSGPVRARTDYRCAAHGCPNAGPINDRGEHARGMCYWHFMAADKPHTWAAITTRIRATPSMGNHGNVPTKPSKWVLEARKLVKPTAGPSPEFARVLEALRRRARGEPPAAAGNADADPGAW